METETLDKVKSGKKVRIVDFVLGRHSSYSQKYMSETPQFLIRLQEMGILKGETITVERNNGSGPIEVVVKGTHLAIGRGIASRVFVEETNE